MKDVLLKIINNHFNVDLDKRETLEVIVTEIANIVKAFDEWKDVKLTMSNMNFDKDHGVYVWDHKVWEYNDLFNYWYNEIRNKP